MMGGNVAHWFGSRCFLRFTVSWLVYAGDELVRALELLRMRHTERHVALTKTYTG